MNYFIGVVLVVGLGVAGGVILEDPFGLILGMTLGVGVFRGILAIQDRPKHDNRMD